MLPAGWAPPRSLDPTPPEAREWLSQELRGPDYHDPWLDSAIRWIGDQIRKLFEGISHLGELSPVLTVLVALVIIGLLAWVLPKVRRESSMGASSGAVLDDVAITSRFYRGLAAQAIREGRYEDAVLDGFRAIAKDMSDRTLLDDAPGRTAHEVSQALASPFPDHATRLAQVANLFDAVRYGRRRASADQASQVQQLDAELVKARPVRAGSPRQGQPV